MFTDPFIIAEVGHNHMGSVEVCKQIFDAAARCGANAVKLQKRDNRSLFTEEEFDRPYDNPNSYGPTYGLHREALEFNEAQFVEVKSYAESLGLIFFATPFDIPSAEFLYDLDCPLFKIASADLTNTPLIKRVVSFGRPIIVSTGGGTWADVDRVYEIVDKSQTAILHCVASYPNQAHEMNLRVVPELKKRYSELAAVGLSDHYNGIAMAEAAYVLGGTVIEKHFTLNHTWRGTDHALSLEPQGLESLVNNIHRIKQALGDGEKKLLRSEESAVRKMGKSIYPTRIIKAGELIFEEDIIFKTPGGGIPPCNIDRILGRVALRDLPVDTPIRLEDVQFDSSVWGVGGWPA